MQTNSPAEIDLLEILANFYATLKHNLVLALVLPLSGIGLALMLAYNSADLYESSLLFETSLLTENECKFLFEQLDKVGIIPGLSKEEDAQVSGLKYEVIKNDNVVPSVNAVSLNEKSVYIKVTARVYNQQVFPALEKALLKFINESYSVNRHRAERERFYSEIIARIENEIRSMDEIKKQIGTSKQATFLNPAELYEQTVKLQKEKTEYEIKREEIKVVHLIKGFDSLTIDAKMNKVMVALIGFALGFLALLFILFLKFFARYFKKYQQTH